MNLHRTSIPYLFLLPGIALVLTFSLFPFVNTILLSFKNAKLIIPGESFTGPNNYHVILTDSRFWYSVFLTLLYTFVSVLFETILGLCLGLMMNRLTPRSSFIRILILIPWTIPTVVTARIWQWMFDYNLGIINYIFEIIKIGRINWLGEPSLAFLSIVIADVWKTAPFVAIIVLAGLSAVPQDIYQASVVDGANSWQRFRFIIFPLLLPILGVAVLFRTIDALRIFDLVYVLTGGGPGGATETLSIYAYKLFFYKGDFGQGAATSVIVLLLVAGFGYFYTKKSFQK